jgi:hypothetical protein
VLPEADISAVTKLLESKLGETSFQDKGHDLQVELLYSPYVFAEYEITEEKLGSGTKLELVSSTHNMVLDMLQLQVIGKPPDELAASNSQFLDEATTFEYLQRGPKRDLVEYVAKDRLTELRKGKFLYVGYDDVTAVVDYFNKLLHFWQYQRAHQEPHKVSGFDNSEVIKFESSFQGNLNRVKEFKSIRTCFRFYAPYWICEKKTGSSKKIFVLDFKGAEQTRLSKEFTNNPDFYNFIRSKTLTVGE